jgi:hypothetical protein
MPVTPDKPAPYAPASTIIELMDRNRDRGLPTPLITETLARLGVPDSLNSRVLYAMTVLDLIDPSGLPTATLEGLRLAPEAEYKKRQEDWLKSAYADIFGIIDPSKDDETRIRDAFRSYQPVGQQARMVTLFQGLCAAAGLIPEKTAPAPRQPRSAPTPAQRQALNTLHKRIINNPNKPLSGKTPGVRGIAGLPPALSGLLESLPDPDQGWTNGEREKFLTTFKAVLDFCFPVVTKKSSGDQDATAA